jgi:serine/threonine protein phosphatase PrpC
VSRAFGDLHLRAAGLTALPELSAWRDIDMRNDSLLVLVSDGVTEALPAQHLCQVAAATASGGAPDPLMRCQ